MSKSLTAKYQKLKNFIKKHASAVIAFSGGLDSGTLCKVCYDVLREKSLAVTAVSETYPENDLAEAKKIAKEIGIKHIFIKTQEFKNKNFISNPDNRCYWCKQELFTRLLSLAKKHNLKYIFDGTIADDFDDVRPGNRAKKELGVISPFAEVGFSKLEVRRLAKQLNLSFWRKPSGTCLSSRIPFGEKITKEKLSKVEKAEDILKTAFGNITLRARHHKDILRIELDKEGWRKLFSLPRKRIIEKLKKIGYKYIVIDWEGYIPAGKREKQNYRDSK